VVYILFYMWIMAPDISVFVRFSEMAPDISVFVRFSEICLIIFGWAIIFEVLVANNKSIYKPIKKGTPFHSKDLNLGGEGSNCIYKLIKKGTPSHFKDLNLAGEGSNFLCIGG
jgi:hypothetical protein